MLVTPVPIDAPTLTEVLNSGSAIISLMGVGVFIVFAGILWAASNLYRRFRSVGR